MSQERAMETLTEPKIARKCAGCAVARAKPEGRMPRGWKRLEEEVYCDLCWEKQRVLRAITMPVASPLDQDWKAFRTSLRQMWRLTAQASNWMATELYAHDV